MGPAAGIDWRRCTSDLVSFRRLLYDVLVQLLVQLLVLHLAPAASVDA